MQRNLDIDEPLVCRAIDTHLCRRRHAICQLQTAPKFLECFRRKFARHLRAIRLAHEKARMEKPLRQRAVIRQEEQSLRVLVEPSDRINMRLLHRQKVDHRAPASLIGNGRDIALRLIQQEVYAAFLFRQRLAVHCDARNCHVRLRSWLTHRHAIHRHAPCRDHLLCLAARRHACTADDFLQSFFHISPLPVILYSA